MITGFLGIGVLLAAFFGNNQPVQATPEAKAIAFLVREVPRWPRENHCFSCHNNGDAARALYAAKAAGWPLPAEALAETDLWLSQPNRWDHQGSDRVTSDKRLARLVFTVTAATAALVRSTRDISTPFSAAARLVEDQSPPGYWPLEGEDSVSSPATYGRLLATFLARQSLAATQAKRFQAAIARADRWLLNQDIVTVTDAAVGLMHCAKLQSPESIDRRRRSLTLLHRGQGEDGGWGQRVLSPSEPFDTALALIALAGCRRSDEISGMIARGRAFLIGQQLEDGSWVETTRPPGNVSYAQRISTCGWATLALLETQKDKPSSRRTSDAKGNGH
jgi:hypothetical protein